MLKFKVGDKVKKINHKLHMGCWLDYSRTDYFKITRISENNNYHFDAYTSSNIKLGSCYGCVNNDNCYLYCRADDTANAPRFKVGDRVVYRNYQNDGDCYGTVLEITDKFVHANDWSIGICSGGLQMDELELVEHADNPEISIEFDTGYHLHDVSLTNNDKIMSIISKVLFSFKNEPEKTFIKAGIIHDDGSPTQEGISLVIMHLLKTESFSSIFKHDVADIIVAENEKKA